MSRKKENSTPLRVARFAHVAMSKIVVDGRLFSCAQLDTRGDDNNCLGYAARDALNVTPQELRRHLIEHIRTSSESKMLSMSIVEGCDDVDKAIEAMENGCFIPADVFVHFVQSDQDIVKRVSFVFLSENNEIYTPVLCHWERWSPTQYIGSDNTHYTTVLVEDSRSLNVLLRGRG